MTSEMNTTDWTIPGAEGERILGTTHPCASGEPRACVLIAHGFKGYKDYGFIPLLTATLAATIPVVAHRFNFSHSGMDDDVSTFGRPDLFEKDTWGKQVFDLGACIDAATAGELPDTPANLPVVILGHSRGGVTCLLTTAKRYTEETPNKPACIITMAAPSRTNTMSEDDRDMLMETGSIETLSSRTGQTLHIGKEWLQEQLDDPYEFDVLAACMAIECPALVIHGDADSTVLPGAASMIADTCQQGEAHLIIGADHVFNTLNPADPHESHSPELSELIGVVTSFINANAIRS